MLEIVNYGKDEYHFPCLVVLGCFDGLHVGHAELLKKAKLQAKINGLDLGVMMFSEGKGGRQVFTFEEKLEMLQAYNVKFILKIDYTPEFKKTKPLDFLQTLEEQLNLKAYMSGKDFRFGEGAKGKSSTLKNYAEDEENGVWYMSVKDVTVGDEKVSTTKVKQLIEQGDMTAVSQLLGKNYFVCGEVVRGADRGGKVLGIPTMNVVYPPDKEEVKEGVYAVQCTVNGNIYGGVANFGVRPTFDDGEKFLEVYLVGFEGENYGENIKVEFLNYIREIKKFDSAEELREQILKDLQDLNAAWQEQPAAAEQPAKVGEQPVETAAAAEPYMEEAATTEAQPAEDTEAPVNTENGVD